MEEDWSKRPSPLSLVVVVVVFETISMLRLMNDQLKNDLVPSYTILVKRMNELTDE